MHHYTDETNLELCLQMIDDPADRAQLIEEAFRLMCERDHRQPAQPGQASSN
jgi:hypothetical protein